MIKFGINGWRIEVGPRGERFIDYLWAVSPPYRTAPHRQIGPGYNLDARDSASLTPRDFRFVTTDKDFRTAVDIAQEAQSGRTERLGQLTELGQGTLILRIIDYAINKQVDVPFDGGVLDWVMIEGESCVPK